METRGILSGLPSDHVVVTFQHMSQVQNAAQDVFDQLLDNDAGSGGNQFVVVLELPESARQQLATDRMCLGMFEFSFMWEFDTGLIKVIPDACHSMTAASIMRHMNQQCQTRMGVPEAEMMIGHKKLHQISGAVKGKHSDSCLWPPSRQGGPSSQLAGLLSSSRQARRSRCPNCAKTPTGGFIIPLEIRTSFWWLPSLDACSRPGSRNGS